MTGKELFLARLQEREHLRTRRSVTFKFKSSRDPVDRVPLCVWCGGRMEGRNARARWCSQACVEDFGILKGDMNLIRAKVEERDKGFCAACGRNAIEDEKLFSTFCWRIEAGIGMSQTDFFRGLALWERYGPRREQERVPGIREAAEREWSRWMLFRIDPSPLDYRAGYMRIFRGKITGYAGGFPIHTRSFWDADHIHPVAHGGGAGTPLEGFQLLCTPCHKAKTAKQSRKAK